MCWSAGRPKARVLPDPVAATPTRSWPDRMMGQHCAWIGDGWAKSLVAWRRSLEKPAGLTQTLVKVVDRWTTLWEEKKREKESACHRHSFHCASSSIKHSAYQQCLLTLCRLVQQSINRQIYTKPEDVNHMHCAQFYDDEQQWNQPWPYKEVAFRACNACEDVNHMEIHIVWTIRTGIGKASVTPSITSWNAHSVHVLAKCNNSTKWWVST